MNWDRVRKENQLQRSGSDWIGSDSVLASLQEPRESPKKSSRKPLRATRTSGKRRRLNLVVANPMPGCTCNKPVGFASEHKKTCPLRVDGATVAHHPIPDPTILNFAECIKKCGRTPEANEFVSKLLTGAQTNGANGSVQHEKLRVLLQVFQLCLQKDEANPAG